MKAERKKQIDYLPYMNDALRVTHSVKMLHEPPEPEVVDENDGVVRNNLEKQISLRKRIIAGLHAEIREFERRKNGH